LGFIGGIGGGACTGPPVARESSSRTGDDARDTLRDDRRDALRGGGDMTRVMVVTLLTESVRLRRVRDADRGGGANMVLGGREPAVVSVEPGSEVELKVVADDNAVSSLDGWKDAAGVATPIAAPLADSAMADKMCLCMLGGIVGCEPRLR
jgi:hypothetical protein